MEIKTTVEISYLTQKDSKKKWVEEDGLKKLLCEIDDPIKFRKALLNALSNENKTEGENGD